MGCILAQGTMSTSNLLGSSPTSTRAGWNVKIVAAISPQLFAAQNEAYRASILSPADRCDSTFISNGSRRLMSDWKLHPIANEYAMTSDFDDRWRTGGTLDEVMEEAHLSPDWLLQGIERFVRDRGARLARIRRALDDAEAGR